MADAMQGIMALPGAPTRPGPTAAPPMPAPGGIDTSMIDQRMTDYARSNPEGFGQDMVDSMGQSNPQLVLEMRNALAGMQLPAEVIDALLTMIDILLQDPENYETNRSLFVREGVPQEFLPPSFDPIFLTGMQMALSEMKRAPEPQRFARGGIAELKPIAKELAKMGRRGDTLLAHITPREARLLKLMGGAGTTNPHTGLPEFFIDKAWKAVTGAVSDVGKAAVGAVKGAAKAVGNVVEGAAKAVGSVVKGAVNVVKQVVKPITNVVKKIAQNPIGRIALTVAATIALGPAGLTTAGVAGSMGLSGAVALGVNTALASTAVNLASGMSVKESLKGGAISGLTAGTVATIFPSTLPAAYQAAPIKVSDVIPPSAPGDYLSSGDAAALEQAAAREAADFAARGGPTTVTPIPGGETIGGTTLPEAIQYPGIQAPGVTAPSVAAPGVTAPGVAVPEVAPIDVASAQIPGAPTMDITAGTTGQITPSIPADVIDEYNVLYGGTPGAGEYVPPVPNATPTTAIDEYNVLSGGTPGAGEYTSPTAPSGGIMDTLKGAYDTVTQPFKSAWETISPSSIQEAGKQAQYDAYTETLTRTGDAALAREAFKAAAPGMLATYGPMALAGTAALAATGAFTPKQPPPPGIVDQDYMRGGTTSPITVTPGAVNTVTAPNIGYGNTAFYSTPTGYNPALGNFMAPQFQVRRPEEYLNLDFLNRTYARGGIASLKRPRTYPRKTGAINGPGTETSDSIPALLSDGEFVFTAKAVRGAGGGSRRLGAKRMYSMMKALEGKANG